MITWHVAITKPFQELIAERHLAQQAFQPFNPKVVVTKIVRNRETAIKSPYIPGYIFIRFDEDDERWKSINSTRGIRQLILAGSEKPAMVRDDAMQILIDRCSGSDIVTASQVDHALAKLIPIGSIVHVKTGPFTGMKGIVEWTYNERVNVLLAFLGAVRGIHMPAKAVEVVATS
jgi:transcriptional antiterminator RfaH